MEGEKIQFKDESGDKEFFTIIPNIIVNGYSLKESGVYLYIKKKAGEKGEFYETKTETCKKLGISYPTFKRILKILEKDGRIEFAGRRVLKTSPVNVYKVKDIWKENIEYYKRELKNKQSSPEKEKESEKICNPESEKICNQRRTNNKEEPILLATQGVAGKELNDLIELFKPINPTYERLFGNNTQRAALERLVKKFGAEKVRKMIECLPKILGNPYAPVITTPYLLEQKLSNLIVYLKAEKEKEGKVWKL